MTGEEKEEPIKRMGNIVKRIGFSLLMVGIILAIMGGITLIIGWNMVPFTPHKSIFATTGMVLFVGGMLTVMLSTFIIIIIHQVRIKG